jgi:fructan beta-fructosidase
VFSVPRELRLRKYPEGLRLVQEPIEELRQLRQSLYHVTDADPAAVNAQLAALGMNIAQEIKAEFALDTAREFGLRICRGEGEETVIGFDAQLQGMFVDRRHSGDAAFSDKFAGVHRASPLPQQGKIRMHIFLDSCSVEVFGDDGCTVFSDLIFPHSPDTRLEVYARGGDMHLKTLDIWNLDAEGDGQ